MWEPQLAALSESYRVIVPDLSGFGASQGVSPDQACRMSDLAADAVALLDHLGIGRAVVGGLSMGGYTALAIAEGAPERLRGLILADTRAGTDAEEARRTRLETAQRVLQEGTDFLVGTLTPRLLGRTTREKRPDVVARVERMIREAPPAGVAAAQRGMAVRPDRTRVLPRLDVPVLILVGEEDELTPPAEAQAMEREVRGGELVTIPEAGHLASLERPETFNEALAGFLRRLRP